jgi:hypothetical protein
MSALNHIQSVSDSRVLPGVRTDEPARDHRARKAESDDRADFSSDALRLAAGTESGAHDRIQSIRDAIRTESYETEHKLNATIERLFADLGPLDLEA